MTEQRISDETPGGTGEAYTQQQPKIWDRCPSCGARSLFIGSGGWLTCSVIGCKEPGVSQAIDDARAALAEAQREIADLNAMREGFGTEIAHLRQQADEAQRENEQWADDNATLRTTIESLEQHVAALRDALERVMNEEQSAYGPARAILANTAAGSAAWLAAHDAETKAPLLMAIENERAQFQCETLRTSECYRLIREMCEVIENTPDAHAHEPDAAAARIGRPGECPRCRLVADARALLARPINDTGSAEKDAQIAALMAALRGLYDKAGPWFAWRVEKGGQNQYISSPRTPAADLTTALPMAEFKQAHDVLADLPAAAAAYTADVRDATIRETGDSTGSPVACPECGAKFYTPGNLNIALHADKEWRETYTARITADVRRAALEDVERAVGRGTTHVAAFGECDCAVCRVRALKAAVPS